MEKNSEVSEKEKGIFEKSSPSQKHPKITHVQKQKEKKEKREQRRKKKGRDYEGLERLRAKGGKRERDN